MPLPKDLLKINLNDIDRPVISFTVTEEERTLEQRVLGALIRKAAATGGKLYLHQVRKRANADEKPVWDYEIRAYHEEAEPGTTE